MPDLGDEWFRTDSLNELMESATFSLEALQRFPKEIGYFRWAIIGSTMSLQGACIFQLHGHDSTSTATLTESSRKKILKHLEAGQLTEFPMERLASPIELLSKVSDPEATSNEFSKYWNADDFKNCEYIAMLRNEFIHFLPQGWSHSLYGFIPAMQSIWKIIEVLVSSPIEYEHRVPSGFRSDFCKIAQSIGIELQRLETL